MNSSCSYSAEDRLTRGVGPHASGHYVVSRWGQKDTPPHGIITHSKVP